MPKHQVIRDVGLSLLGVLRAELTAAKSKAKAFLATPTQGFLDKNAPCLCLYLYDVRGSYQVRTSENWQLEEEVTDESGDSVIVRYGRPLDLALHYLLTARADDLADEHEVLALGMRALLDHGKLQGDQLAGDSFSKDDVVPVAIDDTFTLETSHAVFGGFAAAPRLAVGYRAETRLFSGKELGRTRRVRERHIDVFDPLRPPPGSVSARELGVEARPPKIVSTKPK
jgi:hypothetical protein